MVQNKTSDQYLPTCKVSTCSINNFKRYRLIKTLTKYFNILSDADANADADAGVTAIALLVLSYRRAKKEKGGFKLYYGCKEFVSLQTYEPQREKNGLLEFGPGATQTDLYSLRRKLES